MTWADALTWVLRIAGIGLMMLGFLTLIDWIAEDRRGICPECGLRHGPAHKRAHTIGPDREQIP